jgi:hypothetical protein
MNRPHGCALAFCALLIAVCPGLAQDRVLHRDPLKKTDLETTGTISAESLSQLVVKTTARNVTISAGDVQDVFYQLARADLRTDYRRADNLEKAGDKATGAARKKSYADALEAYRKLAPSVAGQKNVERHVQFKIALLAVRLSADDRTQAEGAIALLVKFRNDHPTC